MNHRSRARRDPAPTWTSAPTSCAQQGLTYRAIAKWLGVTLAMARRRVLRHERALRESLDGEN